MVCARARAIVCSVGSMLSGAMLREVRSALWASKIVCSRELSVVEPVTVPVGVGDGDGEGDAVAVGEGVGVWLGCGV